MDERDKKRRRMNMEVESVNRDHDNEKTDGAQIVATDNRPPKELDKSDIVNLSTTDFKIVQTKLTFVDKSEGIKRFFQCPASGVQITAPRRFGKSTFMNMLKEFLMITVDEDAKPISNSESSDNYKMFMNLKLGQKHGDFVKKHCGQYPVISLSLKSVGGKKDEDVLDSLKNVICAAFQKHSYLLETVNGSKRFKNEEIVGIQTFLKYYDIDRLEEVSETMVTRALKFLSEILYTHFNKKVVILVDEADAPIMKAIIDNMGDRTLKYIMRVLRDMLSAGLKDNEILERSLVSSCVRLSGVYSWDINNQYHALFLQTEDFSESYGFTEQEVYNLLENSAFQAVNDFDGVKKWYNGYQTLNGDGAPIYSGWSVINYLINSIEKRKKMFDNYWAKSGLLMDILKEMLVNHEIQERINKLLKDENISIVVAEPTVDNILELKNTISCPSSMLDESQVDFFLQLLWDDGLLNAIEKNGNTVVLKIPNLEIKKEIQTKCYTQSLFEAKYKLKRENIKRYIQALNGLLLTSRNEQESEEGESNEQIGEIEESEEGTTEKWEKAMRNLVDAVSLLFSDDAAIPVNESELHHILFYLAYNNKLLTTQSSRSVVKVSEELRDTEKLRKRYPDQAKTSSQSKGKEKRGRKNECDICVTCETGGLILELKLLSQDKANENSRAALQQIIDKNYYTLFDKEEYKHVRTKIYVGLCFKKNLDVAAHYLVDSIDINKAKFVCRNK